MRNLSHYELVAIRTDQAIREKKRAGRTKDRIAPILSKARRRHVVDQIMDTLRDWRSSPFQHEASCRHGLRIGFILQGNSWARSDHEAAGIVAEAFRYLGAERPTWDEGQPEHVSASSNCAICWAPLSGQQRGERYCSTRCAETALRVRGREKANYVGAALRSAYRLITKEKAPPRNCNYCGVQFRSDRPDALFCSHACVSRWQKGDALLKDIVCEGCGRTCKAPSRSATCCSKTCAGIVKARKEKESLASTILECPLCKVQFTPATRHQIYCSPECTSVIAKRSWYDRNYKPAAYDRTCLWCGTAFTSKMPWGAVCSRHCRSSIQTLSRPTRRQRKLSPQIFDYLMRAAA